MGKKWRSTVFHIYSNKNLTDFLKNSHTIKSTLVAFCLPAGEILFTSYPLADVLILLHSIQIYPRNHVFGDVGNLYSLVISIYEGIDEDVKHVLIKMYLLISLVLIFHKLHK